MQFAERIYVKENQAMNGLCRKQTPVYNQALYYLRNEYFHLGDDLVMKIDKNGKEKQVQAGFLTYYDLNDKNMLKWKACYRAAIPGCAANTIQRACDAWKAYWKALKSFSENKFNFTGKPKMPDYKIGNGCKGCHPGDACFLDNSKNDKSPVYFSYTDFSIKNHYIVFPKATGFESIHVPRLNDQKIGDSSAPVKQVRVIPSIHGGYWIEAVHGVDIPERTTDESRIMAIDLGMVRMATIVDNIGSVPIAFSGGPIIAINQEYNKLIAKSKHEIFHSDPRIIEIQKKYSADKDSLCDDEWKEWKSRTKNSNRVKKITENRNNMINAIFHRLSRMIVDEAVKRRIGIIVIGHNPGQKQNINMGDKTNQKFVQLPIFKLIDKIRYKAEIQSIKVVEITEEFTSKASFIDGDIIPDRKMTKKKANGHSDVQFSGNRTKRGLYTSASGISLQADVNGAYNILRKAFPDAFKSNGITAEGNPAFSGARLHPVVLDIPAS